MRCNNQSQLASWIAALQSLISKSVALSASDADASRKREAARAAAMAKAAPGLHEEMQQREAALEEELKGKAAKETER